MSNINEQLLKKGIITQEEYDNLCGVKKKIKKPKVVSTAGPSLEEKKTIKKRGRPKKEEVKVKPEVSALVEQMGGADYNQPSPEQLARADRMKRKKLSQAEIQEIFDDIKKKQQERKNRSPRGEEDDETPVRDRTQNALQILRNRGYRT